MPETSAPAVLLAVCLAALASLSATKLPRSTYTFTVSEVFVLAALATLGPAVAVVATGVESTIATRRNSKRLSSRLSSPAAAMAAIWAGGHLYVAARDVLVSWDQSLEVASLAALCGVALVPFLLNTLPLMAMMALKRSEPMRPRQWLADSSGLAVIYLGSAFVAGLVHLNALRFGTAVIVISAGVVLGLVALLRLNLSRRKPNDWRRRRWSPMPSAKPPPASSASWPLSRTRPSAWPSRHGGNILQVIRRCVRWSVAPARSWSAAPFPACCMKATRRFSSARRMPRWRCPTRPSRWRFARWAPVAASHGWPFTAAATRTRTAMDTA
jgi:hypothetical protein